MIRSQIAVRPAVVNGPAVRVHLGGGGVDYWSVRLQKPTPPFPHPPETGRKLSLDRFCTNVTAEISE